MSTGELYASESMLVDFLRVEKDIFAWKPSNMRGISREVVEHSLWAKPGSKLVKQQLRHFDKEKHRAIVEEVDKLPTIRFIKKIHHLSG